MQRMWKWMVGLALCVCIYFVVPYAVWSSGDRAVYKSCTPGKICCLQNPFRIERTSAFHLEVDCHRRKDVPENVLRDLERYSKHWDVPYRIISERSEVGLLPKDLFQYDIRLCYQKSCGLADELFKRFPEKTGREMKKILSR